MSSLAVVVSLYIFCVTSFHLNNKRSRSSWIEINKILPPPSQRQRWCYVVSLFYFVCFCYDQFRASDTAHVPMYHRPDRSSIPHTHMYKHKTFTHMDATDDICFCCTLTWMNIIYLLVCGIVCCCCYWEYYDHYMDIWLLRWLVVTQNNLHMCVVYD